ncbi:hypothetical protein [Exiguobacterium artemiae]
MMELTEYKADPFAITTRQAELFISADGRRTGKGDWKRRFITLMKQRRFSRVMSVIFYVTLVFCSRQAKSIMPMMS